MARTQENAAIEIESLGWMGESFRRLGRMDEGVGAVREAVAIARRSGDRVRVARWLGELALTCCYRGELKEALNAAEEAYQTAVDVRDVNWEALAVDALALVHLMRGDPVQAIQKAERAIEMYQHGSWEHTVIYVLNVQGLAYLDLEEIERAIDCLDRAWQEARVCEDIRVEGMTRFNLAHAYRLKPDIVKAIAFADDAVRNFTRTGGGELPAAQAFADALRARAAGLPAAEARSLVATARASMSNPDLRHPRAILADAIHIALAQLRARDDRAQAKT
jgi:tetratricopeptide (TPR) repeat protein